MRKAILLSLSLGLLVFVAQGCNQATGASAQDSHAQGATAGHDDHGHAAGDPDPVSITLFTQDVLLFMEYPQLVKGQPAEFLAHFSVLKTGEPVRGGTMTLEATGPDGKVERITLDAPKRPGIFIPEHAFNTTGTYRGRLILDSTQAQATIDFGEMVVHANEDAAYHAAEHAAGEDPPNAVSFLLEQQWKVGTLLHQIDRRSLTRRLRLHGEVATSPNSAAFVSAPVTGRLLSPPSGRLPLIGETVEAGDVLGLIEPPLPATEAAALSTNRAQLQAMETELVLRGLDLSVKGLEVERDLRQAETRLGFAKRAFSRIDVLQEKGVGSDQQHDNARQEFELAQAEYDAAESLMESYRESSAALVELREQLATRDSMTDDHSGSMHLPLVSPISGQVASRSLVEGQHVDALEEICEIVNLDRVWVVAQLSEFDLNELPENPNAALVWPAFPDQTFDVQTMGGEFVGIGARVDDQTRTVPIRFEIPNPEMMFRAGMVVDVYLTSRQSVDSIVVPEKAIVMDNGRPLVYVMLEGETFQRREVELGIRDNGWIEVISGVTEGERVATEGAYAIKLASLSPASFGHGHGH